MSSNVERGLSEGLAELRRLNERCDDFARVNREWEVAFKALEASNNELKRHHDKVVYECNQYKAYAIEMRSSLRDISDLIIKKVMDTRGKMMEVTESSPHVDDKKPIPKFLQEGPVEDESRLLLGAIHPDREQ